MKKKQLRCFSCAKRIRSHHPHIGLLDLQTGEERASYHARGGCKERAAREPATRIQRGKAYILRHYHSAACPDQVPGWDCRGGSFSAPVAVAN